MAHDQQIRADELIHTLGALGLAQETVPGSAEVAELTIRALELRDLIAVDTQVSYPASS